MSSVGRGPDLFPIRGFCLDGMMPINSKETINLVARGWMLRASCWPSRRNFSSPKNVVLG